MPYFPSRPGENVKIDRALNEMSLASARPVDPVRVKNRRKHYLDLHPEYFGPDLELAGTCNCDSGTNI